MDAHWLSYLPHWLQLKVRGRLQTQAVLGNSAWLIADKVARLAISVPVTLWTARYFGATDFGKLNYALAFVALFSVIASAGIDRVVVRELVREPDRRNAILGSAFFLKLSFSLSALLLSIIVATNFGPDDRETLLLVTIISWTLIFQCFSVIPLWFQSQTQARLIVSANLMALLVATSARITLMVTGGSLAAFAAVGLLESLIASVGTLHSFRRHGMRLLDFAPSKAMAKEILRDSWPLLLAGLAIILYMRVDMVMLQYLAGPKAVGLYAAATKLSEVWYAVPVILATSALPTLVRSHEQNPGRFIVHLRRFYFVLAWLGIAIALPISLGSDLIVRNLYGPSFEQAGPVLAIHLWSSLAVFLGIGSSQFLLIENLQAISMYRTCIGLACNVALNIWLIPAHGAIGAAVATLVSYFVATFALAFFARTRTQAKYLIIAPFVWPRN